jgi:pimeloyl-ACP methyl ester carboxylesterase
MTSKIRALGIVVVLGFILSLGIALLTFSYSEVGLTSEIESLSAPACDISTVPQSVVENATEKAMELFGDYQEKCDDFVNQLLTLYLEAKGKDFVIVFNPGGWGWDLAEASPDWWSILGGIKSELDTLGYKSLLLDYRRTGETLRARLDEAVEMIAHYPSKARDLAARVRFLTDNVPELRVIVAGESTGTVISGSVMSILKDNPHVYSIQTGSPFWHKNLVLDRTLVITDNGIIPDSFSRGEFFAMMLGNVKALFGVSQPEDDSGRILYYVRAPGHEYQWQYPAVYSQIMDFLDKNFGIE